MTVRLNHFALSADIGSMVAGRAQVPHGAFASSALSSKVASMLQAASSCRGDLFRLEAAASKFDTLVASAFRHASGGYSADRVIADPVLNKRFIETASSLGLDAPPVVVNHALFRLRKTGKLTARTSSLRTVIPDQWRFAFASEVAARVLFFQTMRSVDSLLCDPSLATRFDEIASSLAPGLSSLE